VEVGGGEKGGGGGNSIYLYIYIYIFVNYFLFNKKRCEQSA